MLHQRAASSSAATRPRQRRTLGKSRVFVVRASLEGLLAKAVMPPAAAPAAATVLHFAPLVGAAGGAVLGLAAFGKFALTGRILGISGSVRGLLTGDWALWRFAFVAGLLGGGVIAGYITPGAFDVLPSTFTVERAALGGFLVGLGASMGNGCSSGHGICGNARLSARSLAYTAVFMAAGALAATLTGTAQALGVAAKAAALELVPSAVAINQGAMLLAAAVLGVAGVAQLARGAGPGDHPGVGLLAEAVTGALFAFGLVYSGMVRPAKVAAFLSVTHPAWDPTLACVMGGALAIALPGFWWLDRGGPRAGAPAAPLAGGAFQPRSAAAVDARLLLGGAAFGAGWGISGACPGPALVALVATLRPPPAVAAFVAAMVVGMALDAAARGTLKPPAWGQGKARPA